MSPAVKLKDIGEILDQFDYPVSCGEVVDHCHNITLVLSDGEENLGTLLEGSSADRFESADDLSNEIYNLLPRHAVGEPYQSEGEG